MRGRKEKGKLTSKECDEVRSKKIERERERERERENGVKKRRRKRDKTLGPPEAYLKNTTSAGRGTMRLFCGAVSTSLDRSGP